jgi:hypothetical protein
MCKQDLSRICKLIHSLWSCRAFLAFFSVNFHKPNQFTRVIFTKRTLRNSCRSQGCQMVSFRTKNPNLGNFRRVLQLKMSVYSMAIWSIFLPFGIVYGHLVHFPSFWCFLPVLVCCTKKNLANLARSQTQFRDFFKHPVLLLNELGKDDGDNTCPWQGDQIGRIFR